MSRLWEKILNAFNYIGDNSGCHQIPERCFCMKGYTFPICARCTVVFIGQMVAVILFAFRLRTNGVLSIILLAIMGVDWLLQYLKIRQSTNIRRMITGICGGFGLFNIYMYILIKSFLLFDVKIPISTLI